jgi:hypothetical protein
MLKGTHHTAEAQMKISEAKKGENNPFYGRHHTDETIRKLSEANKGTHLTEETKRKISEAGKGRVPWNKGKHLTGVHKLKISKANSGENNPFYGKHHTDEDKKKMSEAWNKRRILYVHPMKGRHHTEAAKRKISEANRHPTEETRIRMSNAHKGQIPWCKGTKGVIKAWNKGLHWPDKVRKKISEANSGRIPWNYGKSHSEETKEKISIRAKERFKNKTYKEKVLKAILNGLLKRPTSLERKFMRIIENHNLSFAYCGNGTLLIGYKNPDFYETNGRKICIEVANRYHHPNPWAEKRVKHFAKYGWKCLVLFEDELNELPEEEIVRRVKALYSDEQLNDMVICHA